MNNDRLKTYHPFVSFLYFSVVMGFSMFFLHPLLLAISLFCAIIYAAYLRGIKSLLRNIKYTLPSIFLVSLVNPLFNHEGATILTYFPNGNPLTLESIYYGLFASGMLFCILIWFSCYNEIMTSDKIIFLFGKILPALSLLLSMAMRFVPRFRKQFIKIANSQKCLGKDIYSGSYLQRIKNTLTIVSIMVTWALENSIETSDSMRSRGYGLKNRTAFSLYKLTNSDKKALAFLVSSIVAMSVGIYKGALYTRYFPTIKLNLGLPTLIVIINFLVVALFPVASNILYNYNWDRKISKKGMTNNAFNQFTVR